MQTEILIDNAKTAKEIRTERVRERRGNTDRQTEIDETLIDDVRIGR